MGEQLICKMNPTSDQVKKQLSQLRDQWQTLKQTAANQTRPLGGAKNVQEFNTKVDKLEAWMKEKVGKCIKFSFFLSFPSFPSVGVGMNKILTVRGFRSKHTAERHLDFFNKILLSPRVYSNVANISYSTITC